MDDGFSVCGIYISHHDVSAMLSFELFAPIHHRRCNAPKTDGMPLFVVNSVLIVRSVLFNAIIAIMGSRYEEAMEEIAQRPGFAVSACLAILISLRG